MAERSRRKGKSIFEMICDTRNKIANTEEKLRQLNKELDALYTKLFDEFARQQEKDMRELFDKIGMKHIPLKDVIKLLDEQQ